MFYNYSHSKFLRISGAEFIKKKLLSLKTDFVFGYIGGCNLKLFDELHNSSIKIISNRNEQCSGHSAEAYSKVSNKLGIVITTSGPGLTNMITPLQNAYSDGTPLLLISGQVPSDKLGTSAFQECNSTDITKSCVKKNILIKDIYSLVNNFDNFIEEIYTDRKGPVHLDICKNVFDENIIINEKILLSNILSKNKNILLSNILGKKNKNIQIKCSQIEQIKNLLLISKKPVLIVGQGCKENYLILRKFIEKYKLPVCTTLHGLGIIDPDSHYNLGMLGMHGTYQANMAITKADLIIGIANRFDDRTIGTVNTFGLEAKKSFGIIHIDNSLEKINEVKKIINPDISLQIDSKNFFKFIMKLKKFKKNSIKSTNSFYQTNLLNRKYWMDQINEFKIFNPIQLPNVDLCVPNIVSKLSAILDKNKINPIITTGVGVHQMQVAQYFKFNYPNNLITSGSQGTMGVGLPFAIGCQIANPNKMVICIDGDGSFQMTSSDLMTLVEYNLPVKIIIMDNKKLQMVSYWQKKFYESRYTSTKLSNPNFVMFANSFGIEGIYCNDINQLDEIIDKIIMSKSPLLVHIEIEDVDCLPFVPPNKALSQMILS